MPSLSSSSAYLLASPASACAFSRGATGSAPATCKYLSLCMRVVPVNLPTCCCYRQRENLFAAWTLKWNCCWCCQWCGGKLGGLGGPRGAPSPAIVRRFFPPTYSHLQRDTDDDSNVAAAAAAAAARALLLAPLKRSWPAARMGRPLETPPLALPPSAPVVRRRLSSSVLEAFWLHMKPEPN